VGIMDEDNVKLETEGHVARIIINRPKALNALNANVLQSIYLIFKDLEKEEPRAVVITGEGEKAFVAGADIHGMASLGPRAIADYVELGQRVMRTIENYPFPVIAQVNGFALGGGLELALACDLVFAAASAKLGQPEVNLGIIPGFGGTQRLVQRCGLGTARRLVYTGEIISAEEALSLGLVDKIFSDSALKEETLKAAEIVASKAPLALRGAKRVLRQSGEPQLLSGLRLEVEEFLALFATADREEGMEAFIQKRKPVFHGN
jgi:enoyl-CoA hydratase